MDRERRSAVAACRASGVGVARVAGKESEDVFSARSAAEQNRELGLDSPDGRKSLDAACPIDPNSLLQQHHQDTQHF